MNTIPLNTFLSSTLGLPRDFGKYGFSRSIVSGGPNPLN
jgi:hypothetical protein